MINTKEFVTYLSAKLNATGEFKVIETRNLKYKDDKVNAILNLQVGTYFEKTFEQPFQIDFFTNKPKETMELVQKFVADNTNQRWENGDYTIINALQMPFFVDRNISGMGTNIGAQIVIYGSFLAVKSPLDIKTITINEDNFIPISMEITGVTQEDSALEKSGDVRAFTATNSPVLTKAHFVLYSYNNDASVLLRKIVFRKLKSNTTFDITYNFVDGEVFTDKCIVINPTLSKSTYTELAKWDLTFLTASKTIKES